MRQMRSAMLDSLGADYVRTARAKGLSEWTVVGVHALRNSLITVTTVIGLQLGALISGAVITEQIFGIAGFGRLTIDAVNQRDYALIQGVVLVAARASVVNLARRRRLLAAQSAHPRVAGRRRELRRLDRRRRSVRRARAAGCCAGASCAGRWRSPGSSSRSPSSLRGDLRAAGRAVLPRRRPTSTPCSPSRRSSTCSAPTSSAATSSRGSSGARARRSRPACSRRCSRW